MESVYRRSSDSTKRKALSKLLSKIHQDDFVKLVSFVDTAPPDELLIWADAIGKEKLEMLSIPWRDFDTKDGFAECSEAECVKQANRVLTLYSTGNINCLLQSLEDRKDPRIRTYVVHRFRESRMAIMPLIEKMLVITDKPDVLS
jgi:hypothetical protein